MVQVGKHGRLWGEQKMISALGDATHRSGAWSAQPFGSRPGLNGLAASDLNPLEPACWRTGFNIPHHRGWAAVPLSSSTITVAGLTHSPASRLLQVILRQMHDRRDATILRSCQTHYLPHTPTRRSRLAGEPVSTSTITVAGLTHSPASRLLQVIILRQMHELRDATIFGSCQTHLLRHTPTRRSRLAGEPFSTSTITLAGLARSPASRLR